MTDNEALPILLDAIRTWGGQLAAVLRLPASVTALRQRVTWLRAFAAEHTSRSADADAVAACSEAETASQSNGAAALTAGTVDLLRAAAELPDLSDAVLVTSLESWLGQHVTGMRSLAQVQKLDWDAIFKYAMSPSFPSSQDVLHVHG